MAASIAAGATMINDVTAMTGDPDSLSVVINSDVSVCLMHMQGNPHSMQDNPHYNNVVQDVFDYLHERIAFCETAGIEKSRLIVDPGIGFGKNLEHNLALIRNVTYFKKLGVPILAGLSRKRFVEGIFQQEEGRQDTVLSPENRVSGSLAAALWCMTQGVQLFRVHDVAQTKQAFAVFRAVAASEI